MLIWKPSVLVGLCLLLLLNPLSGLCQELFHGQVSDSKTGLPVPFALIRIKNQPSGFSANDQGVYRFYCTNVQDTLLISQLGYNTVEVAISKIRDGHILLDPSQLQLNEVVVEAFKEDYVSQVHQVFKKYKRLRRLVVAKGFLALETRINQVPGEIIEAFYNVKVAPTVLEDIRLKTGRMAIDTANPFLTLNTTRFIRAFNPFKYEKHQLFPKVFTQLSLKRLKSEFICEQKGLLITNGDSVSCFSFSQKTNSEEYLEGEVFVDLRKEVLHKIVFRKQNIRKTLFKAINPLDKVNKVGVELVYTYVPDELAPVISAINFNYRFTYEKPDKKDSVQSSAHLQFYRHQNQFSLPNLNLGEEYSDYQRMLTYGYHPEFWEFNYVFPDVSGRKEFVSQNGVVDNTNPLLELSSTIIKSPYFAWSANKMISFSSLAGDSGRVFDKKDWIKYGNGTEAFSPSDLYSLDCKILMDKNELGEKKEVFLTSLVNLERSFYFLPNTPLKDAFITLNFDLYEVARRKMQVKFESLNSFESVDMVYDAEIRHLEAQVRAYLKETHYGTEIDAMKKWNAFVSENIGVKRFDNDTIADFVKNSTKELFARNSPKDTIIKETAGQYFLIGAAHLKRGNYSVAFELLEKALKIEPRNEDILFNLGTSCFYLNQMDKACMYWERADKRGDKQAHEMVIKHCKK